MTTQPFKRIHKSPLDNTLISGVLLGIAGVFILTGVLSLDASTLPVSLSRGHLLALLGGWMASWAGTCWVLHRKLKTCDPLILPIVALLTGWGLLLQARLAPRFMLRQLVWLYLGNTFMCYIAFTSSIPRLLRRYRYTILTCGLILLGATLFFGVNPSGYGQQLWLGGFGLYLQPSEPLKLLMIIYLASYLSDRRDLTAISAQNKRLWLVVLGPMLVMVGAAMVLLLWQQDLGAALLFYLTFTAMLYLAWGKVWYILLSLFLFIPVAVSGYFLSSRVALRVNIWLHPWLPENADRAFQILQSIFAFGSGGIIGQGLGQGYPTLIPAVHTDFVYAALVEEFGFLGSVALIILMCILTARGISLAQKSQWPFESLLAGGIAAMIGIQTWVIAGGNAKLIPITGVTFPFLSYGGSSLVTMLAAIGLLINLSTPHPPPVTITLQPTPSRPIRLTAARLGIAILGLALSVVLITSYWSINRAGELRENATNPRFILAEARIHRGQILDRNAVALADISLDEWGYVTRTYPVPEAAPVIGYATLEHGLSGIEATCDLRLRGDYNRSQWDKTWDQLNHVDPEGQDVRLTINAIYQQYAYQQLSNYTGAAILVDAHTGEILVLASSPTYDPTYVDENWDTLRESLNAPLLNRVTQGLVQPGAILESVILASFWDIIEQSPPVTPVTAPVEINGTSLSCQYTPKSDTWGSIFAAACPAPFSHLGNELDVSDIQIAFETWRLLQAPQLEIPTLSVDWNPAITDITDEILGQGQLLVTPLHMVSVAAILGNEGQLVDMHLLLQPLPGCGEFSSSPELSTATPIIPAETALAIRAMLPRYGKVIGHSATALAGPERIQSWFIGLNSNEVPRYAVAVLIESDNPSSASVQIGSDLLNLATGLLTP